MTVRAVSSHEPSQSTTRVARTTLTKSREWWLRPRRRPPRPWGRGAGGVGRAVASCSVVAVGLVSSNTGGSSGTGDLHFLAQAVPDASVEGGESGGEADLLDF